MHWLLPRIPRQAMFWLALVWVVAYANSLNGAFQFDDFNVIVDQGAVHSLDGWLADLGQGIRPLLKLSYTLNWISGWGAPGFHAVNLLIHGLTVWLVYRLSQELLAAQGLLQGLPQAPWMCAALFALHPANTEAVTYICGRSTALMALLYLAGLLAHATQSDGQRMWRNRVLVPVYFVMAVAVKESAVTFPLALVLWDLACGRSWTTTWRRSWSSWAALLLVAAFMLWNDAYRASAVRSVGFNTLTGNAATQVQALAYLLRQWAWPLWLNIDPDLAVQQDFSRVLPALGLLVALVLGTGLTWHTRHCISFALAWLLLHLLLLYVAVPRLDVANDRQLYLAAWPLGLALVVELQRSLPLRLAAGLVVGLLLSGAMLTAWRNQDYWSEVRLWEQTVHLSPDKSRVHANLAYAYQLAGLPVQARFEYLQALRLDPGNVKARLNLRRLNALRPRT
jgi:hypothetical protein